MAKYQANPNRYQNMQYNRSGSSGLKLPAISLGLWHNFGDNANFNNIKNMCFTAFDNGITHFDLANNYGPKPGSAESNFSKILAKDFRSHRDELIISTKAGYLMWDGPYGNGGSRKYLISSLDQSLKRLGLNYVDIFYHHCMDKNTPIEESMLALSQIVKSGKALYVGLSNYDGENLVKACKILDQLNCPFIINQNRYNIFERTIEKNGLLEKAESLKKGIICFCPLAQGLLTDRYLNGIPNDSRIRTDGRFLNQTSLNQSVLEKITKLNQIALSRGESLATTSLKWLLTKPQITSVLIGASKPQQILENLKALSSPDFTPEQLKQIDQISQG